jgi:xanthine dehydrogenase accessory factor
MSEIDQLIESMRAWAPAPMALATVTATWGSAPRPRGSHMLVCADGRFEGSVSGGCVEGEVLAAAAETIADGKARRLRYGVTDASAWEVGLPCGGEIALIVQPLTERGFPPALLDRIAEARAAGRSLAVTTDLESGASREGVAEGADIVVNRYQPPRRLFVIGAVQIAQPLIRIAREMDVAPALIDPRARFLTPERFPDTLLDDRWPDEAIAAFAPDAASAVVTLSHDPKIDDPALIAALRSPAAYVAALGSRRSHAARLDRLRGAGFSEEQLARIDAPAGIHIGALGPAEIALSIAAGMVRAFRGANA